MNEDRCTALAVLLVLSLLAASPAAEAQQTNVARVALLTAFPGIDDGGIYHAAFRQRLGELGWIEGRNLQIIRRHASNSAQQRTISAEMERDKVDVVLACSPCAFYTRPSGLAPIRGIPIVFAGVSDPVGAGMALSLNRPGGNMTGLSFLGVDLNVKRLQLLNDALPHATRVAILLTKDHLLRDRMTAEISRAAATLHVNVQFYEIASGYSTVERQRAEIDQAFETMAAQRTEAVLVLQGPHFARERNRIAELGSKYRIPGSYELADYARAGGFMAYSVDWLEIYRRAADYVDKILKGAKPADLPVEQPTKFELVINLKTAKALGLTIPPSLLLRADQVIE